MQEIKVGSSVKVFLKGEAPWVTVLGTSNGNLIGKIDNHLLDEETTGYRFGDVVEFNLKNYGDYQCWEPVGLYPHVKPV